MYQSYARAGLLTPEVASSALYSDRDTAIPVDFRDPKTKLFDMKVYERPGPQPEQPLDRPSSARSRGASSWPRRCATSSATPIRVSEAEAWDEYQRRNSTATLGVRPREGGWAARWAVDAQPGATSTRGSRTTRPTFDKPFKDRKTGRRAEGGPHPAHPGEAALRRDGRREGGRAREAVVGRRPHQGGRAVRRGRARACPTTPAAPRRGATWATRRTASSRRSRSRPTRSSPARSTRGRRRDAVRLPLHR